MPGECEEEEGGMTETGVHGRRVLCHVTGKGLASPIEPYGTN